MPAIPAALSNDALVQICQAALEHPFGLWIDTTNVHGQINSIYRALSEAGITTEELGIMLCVPSKPNVVFIMKRSVELES